MQLEADEIKILIFFIAGVGFGMDMDNISEIRRPDLPGNPVRNPEIEHGGHRIKWFHELTDFKNKTVHYINPLMLKIRGTQCFIIVEQPVDISLPVSIDDIMPLPFWIRQTSIWGTVIIEGKIILLSDPYKLLAGTSSRV